MTQDTEIIYKVLEGDIESFRLLVEKYERPVVRMIKNITDNRESCEDIAQDVFFAAYRKLASFDPSYGNFSTWLLTIARNKSINALKRKKAVLRGELPEMADCQSPPDNLAQKEMFEQLDRRLRALPFKQRRALILAEFEKLSYEEAAQIECVRLGTIKSRINRAKKKLRLTLEGFGEGKI